MTDYVPAIAHAASRLAINDAPTRHALYERARVALVEQLRGLIPGTELVREQANLETAIRKVEAQHVPAPQSPPEGVTPLAPLPKLFPRADK